MTSSRTHISDLVAQWSQERPDLDASPLLVIGQMARLTQLVDPLLRPPFDAAGLGNGEFDVLAALRRAGRPFTLTPGQLATSMLVTTGAVTKRVDRLQDRDLVRRTVSTDDARGRLVHLTPQGVGLTDQLIAVHLGNEARLLSVLNESDRTHLALLLGRLAESLESSPADSSSQSSSAGGTR